MTTLREHIKSQQSIARDLEGLLEALSVLDNEGEYPSACTSLINVALTIAIQLTEGLDSAAMPIGDEA
ncbi:hypothetical protein MASR1M32_39180 [Rhodobacter sp.]